MPVLTSIAGVVLTEPLLTEDSEFLLWEDGEAWFTEGAAATDGSKLYEESFLLSRSRLTPIFANRSLQLDFVAQQRQTNETFAIRTNSANFTINRGMNSWHTS